MPQHYRCHTVALRMPYGIHMVAVGDGRQMNERSTKDGRKMRSLRCDRSVAVWCSPALKLNVQQVITIS